MPFDYNACIVPGHSKQVSSLTRFLYYYIFTHTNNERFEYNINMALENINNKNYKKIEFSVSIYYSKSFEKVTQIVNKQTNRDIL